MIVEVLLTESISIQQHIKLVELARSILALLETDLIDLWAVPTAVVADRRLGQTWAGLGPQVSGAARGEGGAGEWEGKSAHGMDARQRNRGRMRRRKARI